MREWLRVARQTRAVLQAAQRYADSLDEADRLGLHKHDDGCRLCAVTDGPHQEALASLYQLVAVMRGGD